MQRSVLQEMKNRTAFSLQLHDNTGNADVKQKFWKTEIFLEKGLAFFFVYVKMCV